MEKSGRAIELPNQRDYSQDGQSLIIEQLITADTPRIVVDIGAHDGLTGSNSRALLEKGWRGLLVEPMPPVFQHLVANCRTFPNAECVPVACSDRDGTAEIFFGRDSEDGQLASMSREPEVVANLSAKSTQVITRTLATLLSEHKIPDDFGVLLVDTEGLDLTVLRGLNKTAARPRIIVTEQLAATNEEKYDFLRSQGYRFAGMWGSDSVWVWKNHPVNLSSLRYPVSALPNDWKPVGKSVAWGAGHFDGIMSSGKQAVGWAFFDTKQPTDSAVVLEFQNEHTNEKFLRQAWRFARPDVSAHFQSEHVLFSGYRAFLDLAPGTYRLLLVQQAERVYAASVAGQVTI